MTKPPDKRAAGRAIKYAGAIGGMSLAEINELLQTVGLQAMPKSSFDIIKNSYVPLFLEDNTELGYNIRSPRPLRDVSARRLGKS